MEKSENKKLKAMRLEKGYTYQDMADKLGVCKAFYWQVEHNNRRVPYDLAKKIASIFEKKPDDLFYEETK